jgi:hypothetical protein
MVVSFLDINSFITIDCPPTSEQKYKVQKKPINRKTEFIYMANLGFMALTNARAI